MEHVWRKCRACLKECKNMNLLFLKHDGITTLAKMLEKVLGVMVIKEEGYSNQLCRSCTQILVDFIDFKDRFEQATEYFKNTITHELQNISLNNQVNIGREFIITPKTEEKQLQDDDSAYYSNYENKPDLKAKQYAEDNLNSKCELRIKARRKNAPDELLSKIFKNSRGNTDSHQFCKICKQYFVSNEFDLHFETHKVHICKVCGHKFIRRTDLNDHEEIHLKSCKYVCQHCGKAFKVRTALNKHRRIHTNPREEICEVCGQRFNTRDNLKIHYKLKHIQSKEFQCNLCGSAFALKSSLAKHIERHNPNRQRTYSCNLCDASYINKYTLSRHHIIKHTAFENRPSCEFCSRRYTKKIDLVKHINKHRIQNSEPHYSKRGSSKQKP